METTQEDTPDLRETPGGWLAVAVDSPKIAVIGTTRDDALAKFRAERAEWRELIAQAEREHPDKDERVKLPLDSETALRALLAVNPDDEPAGHQPGESRSSQEDPESQRKQ